MRKFFIPILFICSSSFGQKFKKDPDYRRFRQLYDSSQAGIKKFVECDTYLNGALSSLDYDEYLKKRDSCMEQVDKVITFDLERMRLKAILHRRYPDAPDFITSDHKEKL